MAAFEITHTTKYGYTRPVFLEPHTIRLRPRCDAAQALVHFEFDIRPRPAGFTQSTDLDGNIFLLAWFHAVSESLTVKTVSRVIALRHNPFDYIVTEKRAASLPLNYVAPDDANATLYSTPAAGSPVVEQFAKSMAEQSEWKTLRFLTALNREIYESFRQVSREYGDARSGEETFLRKEGSCRDLAVLFIDACRYLGIAARFVSGYHIPAPRHEPLRLHAWAEIYLPGAGWRGYDPSQGLAVADQHVAVAAAATPAAAAAISGSFRGDAVESCLTPDIAVREIPEATAEIMQQMQQQ